MVALRKESVDRNADRYRQLHESYQSLSARRAWIEILRATHICRSASVALRKESVDRNNRRFTAIDNTKIVALRKESVDRNYPHCPERQ